MGIEMEIHPLTNGNMVDDNHNPAPNTHDV